MDLITFTKRALHEKYRGKYIAPDFKVSRVTVEIDYCGIEYATFWKRGRKNRNTKSFRFVDDLPRILG